MSSAEIYVRFITDSEDSAKLLFDKAKSLSRGEDMEVGSSGIYVFDSCWWWDGNKVFLQGISRDYDDADAIMDTINWARNLVHLEGFYMFCNSMFHKDVSTIRLVGNDLIERYVPWDKYPDIEDTLHEVLDAEGEEQVIAEFRTKGKQ